MSTIIPVNVWTNPNDWTGDSIRESFNKVNTNITNLNADKLDKVTDTLDNIPVWATNKHINQTQLNKIEDWVMLTDTDCDTVTTWGRYWMLWTPVNWPQAWEFFLEVLSDWTRIMQIATYLDNTVWTRYYNWTVWSTWVFWKATWDNTWDQTNITWNAWTATALQTARTINWVSFDWTANISVPSDITPWTSWNVLTSNWTAWESQAPAWWGGWISEVFSVFRDSDSWTTAWVNTLLTWVTALVNDNSNFNLTNDEWTCPSDWDYIFDLVLYTEGTEQLTILWLYDGTDTLYTWQSVTHWTSQWYTGRVFTKMTLTAWDKVRWRVTIAWANVISWTTMFSWYKIS